MIHKSRHALSLTSFTLAGVLLTACTRGATPATNAANSFQTVSTVAPAIGVSELSPSSRIVGLPDHRLRTRIFVSSYAIGVVYCYTRGGKLTGRILNFRSPQGEAVTKDLQQNLVVADSFGHRIQLFAFKSSGWRQICCIAMRSLLMP